MQLKAACTQLNITHANCFTSLENAVVSKEENKKGCYFMCTVYFNPFVCVEKIHSSQPYGRTDYLF